MLVCASLHNLARETAGAARTRLSLRPLAHEGGTSRPNLARNMRRDREAVSRRHCERSEAIHGAAYKKAGLLTWGWCVSICLVPYVCDPRFEPVSTIWFACQIKLTFGRRSRRLHQDSACDG